MFFGLVLLCLSEFSKIAYPSRWYLSTITSLVLMSSIQWNVLRMTRHAYSQICQTHIFLSLNVHKYTGRNSGNVWTPSLLRHMLPWHVPCRFLHEQYPFCLYNSPFCLTIFVLYICRIFQFNMMFIHCLNTPFPSLQHLNATAIILSFCCLTVTTIIYPIRCYPAMLTIPAYCHRDLSSHVTSTSQVPWTFLSQIFRLLWRLLGLQRRLTSQHVAKSPEIR